MTGNNIQKRTFVVTAGMTPDDVINSKNATSAQKMMAKAFDSDGIFGYSSEEATRFNKTSISLKSNNEVSLYTRDRNGNIINQQHYKGDLSKFKYMEAVNEYHSKPMYKDNNIYDEIDGKSFKVKSGENRYKTFEEGSNSYLYEYTDGSKGIAVRTPEYTIKKITQKDGKNSYFRTYGNKEEKKYWDGSLEVTERNGNKETTTIKDADGNVSYKGVTTYDANNNKVSKYIEKIIDGKLCKKNIEYNYDKDTKKYDLKATDPETGKEYADPFGWELKEEKSFMDKVPSFFSGLKKIGSSILEFIKAIPSELSKPRMSKEDLEDAKFRNAWDIPIDTPEDKYMDYVK